MRDAPVQTDAMREKRVDSTLEARSVSSRRAWPAWVGQEPSEVGNPPCLYWSLAGEKVVSVGIPTMFSNLSPSPAGSRSD